MLPLFFVSIFYLLSKITTERDINRLVDMGYDRESAKKIRKRR